MAELTEYFRVRNCLVDLAPADMKAIQALRLWALLQQGGQPAQPAVADRLGSPRAAAHLHLFLEEIAAAWPEPFVVSPVCCRRLSHDEMTLAHMIALGRSADRPGFDRLLCEMIGADARERLFVSASVIARFV